MCAKKIVDRPAAPRIVVALIGVLLGAPASASAQCALGAPNLPGAWCNVDGAHVRVWWDQAFFFEGEEQKAIAVRDYVEGQLWPLYAKLLGRLPHPDPLAPEGRLAPRWFGGDGRYDIVLTGHLLGTYGESPLVPTPEIGAPPARFSMIRRTLTTKKLRAAVAHQLMRGFLTAFNCHEPCWWLAEATATWAEHLAQPTANTEHEYATAFLRQPRVSLHYDPDDPNDVNDVANPDRHKSGAYLFLLFLQYEVAGDITFIRTVWAAAEASGDPLAALNAFMAARGGFQQLWRKFIAANWNAQFAWLPGPEAVLSYHAVDRLKAGVHSLGKFTDFTGQKRVDVRSVTSTEKPLSVTLPPLSAAYFFFEFDLSVRNVRLVHNLQNLRAQGADLAVFTRRTGEDWKFEPRWVNENSRQFCRDAPGEHLDQMVVILGNASMTSTLSFAGAKLVASSTSCVTNPDVGYEECRLEFPFTSSVDASGVVKEYQNVETQRWEISGPPTTTASSVIYPYRWTTTGFGASTRKTASTVSKADWTISGTGLGGIELLFGQILGQAVRVARNVDLPIEVVDGVRGKETVETIGTSMKHTVPFTEDWFEYIRPRSAPISAPSFEGFAVSPLHDSWRPGVHEVGSGTIACRWHWPRKP